MTDDERVFRTVISYTDNYGIEREVVIVGDFIIGRKDEDGLSSLQIKGVTGSETRIMPCDRSISRKHARCFWNQDKLFIQDIGSTNGTFINGLPLEGWCKKETSRPLSIPRKVQIQIAKEYSFSMEPKREKDEVSQLLETAGVAPGTPVIINIDKSKHIGSVDIAANRSNVVIDTEEYDQVGEKKRKLPPPED